MEQRPQTTPIVDRLGRPLRDLRISVTDRCNFRCRYCMPREIFGDGHAFMPRTDLLTYEEIHRTARIAARFGVTKFRVTGGEPLIRHGLPELVRMLVSIPGADVAVTTNGSMLAQHAEALAAAGLRRITVSLDSLDEDVFQRMNDAGFPAARVLEGIDAAARAGIAQIKINTVVRRGVNDHTIVDLAERFRGTGHIVRFIEFMDVGNSNGWHLDDVVTGSEIVRAIDERAPLEPVDANYRGEVARRYRYRDGSGEIGVITSVSQPFCGDCTRARLSADGAMYTCLFATQGTDMRALLRSSASDDVIAAALSGVWSRRTDRYSELRTCETRGMPRIEMSYIGG